MGYSNVQAGNTLSPADDEKGIAANVIFEKEPSSMAYTADADPDAVAEIAERLRIPDNRVYEEQESGYYHAYFGAHDIVAILGPEQIYNFDFSSAPAFCAGALPCGKTDSIFFASSPAR